jgi:hypothetical protein
MEYRYYRPIPEFIAGFAVTTARPHRRLRMADYARPAC